MPSDRFSPQNTHAREILKLLAPLCAKPAGAELYREVAYLLQAQHEEFVRNERAYASALYTLLDAYAKQLPPESALHAQVKTLQQRLIPPASMLSAGDRLRAQIDAYAAHISGRWDVDHQWLCDVLSPMLRQFTEDNAEAPAAEQGSGAEAAPPQHGDNASPSDSPTATPATAPRPPDAPPKPLVDAEPSAAPASVEIRSLRDAAEQGPPQPPTNTPGNGFRATRERVIGGVQDDLVRHMRETVQANQQFGQSLRQVLAPLLEAGDPQSLRNAGQALHQQLGRLQETHNYLSRKLDLAERNMQILELDSRRLRANYTEAQIETFTDELTELPNRHAFKKRLQDEVARVQRYGMALSLVLLDLDQFKTINDSHGHAAGDEVLRRYASRILCGFRHHDLVARFGGEEFALLFPNTDRGGAMAAIRKMRERIERLNREGGLPVPTFSAGLATYRPGESADELIERADGALYRAKHNGRNRMEWDAHSSQTLQ